MHPNFRLRRLAALTSLTVVAVGLSACAKSSAPSPHQSGAAGAHKTSTSTTAGRSASTSAPTTTTSLPASKEVTFYPFTAKGAIAPGLQVTQQVSGHCTSPGVAGAASYRCTAEPAHVSYDPCFAPPLATTGPLLCVPDPTVIDIIRFSVGALPKASTTASQTRVWAMRLQNGEVCVLVNAAWNGRGPFACPTPSTAGSVADCHTPDKTAHGWSTECQAKENATSPFDTVRIVNVWN
jgi:hypothetical protein